MTLGDINNDGKVDLLDVVFLESHLHIDNSGNRPSDLYDVVSNEIFLGGTNALADYVIGKTFELEQIDLHIIQINNQTLYKLSELGNTRLSGAKLTFEDQINSEEIYIPPNWKFSISNKTIVLYSSIRNSIRNTEYYLLLSKRIVIILMYLVKIYLLKILLFI